MSRKFIAISQRGEVRFQRANRSHHKANNPASQLVKVNEHYTQAPYRGTMRPFYRQTLTFYGGLT